ncbi:MAG: hypothetical protein Q8O67_24740 [Deltaproteobacteria bacterium]|nr:hypothetical protein [Deltaproteobacteria bacterium]
MKQAAAVVVVVVVCCAGCWPDWAKLFDTTPSREHRVEDLRVLAIRAEPAAFTVALDGTVADVVVTPAIYDPRGGQVTMHIGVCGPPSVFRSCTEIPVDVRTADLDVDATHPLGRVRDTATTIRLTADDVRALLLPSASQLSVVPLQVSVVVDVSRRGAGDLIERERATLSLPLRLDPRTATAIDDERVRLCADPADPRENGLCLGIGVAGTCGDGVVDDNESCDPPDGDRCRDDCVSRDPCARVGPVPCLERLPPNLPPRITGFDTDPERELFTLHTSAEGMADVAAGGLVVASRGGTIRFAPIVDVDGAFDLLQEFPLPSFDGRCGVQVRGGCAGQEAPSVRFYARDGRFDFLVRNTGIPVNESGNTIGELAIKDTAETRDEVVVVVVSDGRGGLDFAELTLALE